MISMFGVESRPWAIMRPTGFSPFRYSRTSVSFTRQRSCAAPQSSQVRSRPSLIGIRSASKYPGVTALKKLHGWFPFCASTPGMVTPLSQRPPISRRVLFAPTAFTPGTLARPSISERNTCRLRASSYTVAGRTPKFTTFSVRNPRSTLRRFWRVRTKRPAPIKQQRRQSATCNATRVLRRRTWPWLPATDPASSLSAAAGETREPWSAGARPKTNAVSSVDPDREQQHAQVGRRD